MQKKPSNTLADRLFAAQIRYAAIMTIVAFLFGLFYREFQRPFFKTLTFESKELYGHAMSLVHGHTFLLGVVIPMVMAVMAYMLLDKLTEKQLKNMNIRFTAYSIATVVALLLMAYKGVAFIVGAGQDFAAIDNSLFFGSRLLRGIFFGLSHVTIFWALGEYMAAILRAVKPKA